MTGGNPVAPAFRSAVAEYLGDGSVTVRRSHKTAVGDFALTTARSDGPRAERAEECRRLVRDLCASGLVSTATAIPPAIIVRPSLPLLRAWVIEAARTTSLLTPAVAGAGPVITCYSCPNLNKPLHIGHLRNNAIGMALARLAAACGVAGRRESVHSDWGIHICQAAAAYERWGAGATPESAGIKPDHFVGRYYAMFHAEEPQHPELTVEAQDLLRRMEAGDPASVALGRRLTQWAETGIAETYERIGSEFDLIVREHDTLPFARTLIEDGLERGVLVRRDDDSICLDLSERSLGVITFLRRDGTPLVYGQALGARVARWENASFDRILFVLGEEWRDGATALNLTMTMLGYDWAERIELVTYRAVRLREGRMRSREGNVVTVDDLLDRVAAQLPQRWPDGGLLDRRSGVDAARLAADVAKYYFLGFPRERTVEYDEDELFGSTVPQLAAVLRLAADPPPANAADDDDGPWDRPGPLAERRLLLALNDFTFVVERAMARLEPANLVRYLNQLDLAVRRCVATGAWCPSVRAATARTARDALHLLNLSDPLAGRLTS